MNEEFSAKGLMLNLRYRITVGVVKKIQSGESEICLWKITESDDSIDIQVDEVDSQKPHRTIQYKAGRAALHALNIPVSDMEKDEFGKPHLPKSKKQISLSHCKKYAAAISSNSRVGIDVEEITPRVEKIAKRFVHPTEEAFLPIENRLEALYLLWSAKEALYKLYGKKAVDFRDHMIAKPFELKRNGFFYMEFLKHKPMLYLIQYEIFDNHSLVWVEE